MKNDIKKIIFRKLNELPPNKSLLWPDFQCAFEVATGKSLEDHLDDIQAVANELEEAGYVRFEKLPRKVPRIIKGVNYEEWEYDMKPEEPKRQVNISSLNAQNVQVGDGNTINVNITPEEFVNALNQMQKEPERAKSILSKLADYIKQGCSLGQVIAKFISFFS